MAKEQAFNDTIRALFDGMNGFVSTRTVVGEAVTVEDAVIIPLIDVSFGMGAGAFTAEKSDKGAGGVNGKLSPSSVLIIKDGSARVINIKDTNTVNKLIDMVPDLVNRFTKKMTAEEEEAIEKIKE